MIASPVVKGGTLRLDDSRRLLLIQSGDIGDVVLSTPCLVALRNRFPESHISVAVRRKARELMEDCPFIDSVLIADQTPGTAFRKTASAIQQVRLWRKAHFDLAIDLRTGTRGAIMARACGAHRRVSFYARGEAFWRNWMFTHLAEIPYRDGTYVADYYHRLLEAFGISDEPGRLQLWTNPDRRDRVQHRCREKGLDLSSPFIALQPFSLWSYKELPESHYIRLIREIHSAFGMPAVIVGGPAERQRAETICQSAGPGAINMAGETSIGELPALLQKASLFVGIDSAGLHIAAAMGCPTIGIFGPSASASWAPRGVEHMAIQAQAPCSPCLDKGCRNSEVSTCLQELPVSTILKAVEKQLELHR